MKWTQGESKESHKEWVSDVKFSPTSQNPVIVSVGWDKAVKVWHLSNFQLKSNFIEHTGPINTVTISPDGSLAASGGVDGTARLWDLSDNSSSNPLHRLETGEEINQLCFSPNRYWLCCATNSSVKIFDLEHKSLLQELSVESVNDSEAKQALIPKALTLTWSQDGQSLFVGYSDNCIRVFDVSASA